MSACCSLRLHSPLKQYFGNWEILTKPIAIHIKHILWLPAMEAWDNPWIETLT